MPLKISPLMYSLIFKKTQHWHLQRKKGWFIFLMSIAFFANLNHQTFAAPQKKETKKSATEKTSSSTLPISGKSVPQLAEFDRQMIALMKKWDLTGSSLAIAKDGRLVYARGFGWADKETKQKVTPNSLFRIASISKPITAVVVLRLVEQGKLKLNDRVFDILSEYKAPQGAKFDKRLKTITIRHLLQHSGGWDRDRSYDAMFIPLRAAIALGEPAPAHHKTVIRYMMGQRLDFTPGERYSYSNLGYAILGRVIEKVTGKPYETVANELVLKPAGINQMKVGRTLKQFRAKNEVTYYYHSPDQLADSVFLYTKRRVPWPYGGFHLEAMDSHGAWIASPTDLVRFATAIDGQRNIHLLNDKTVAEMLQRPKLRTPQKRKTHYGFGWTVLPAKEGNRFWHGGSLPGTMTLLLRTHNGICYALTFNNRPKNSRGFHDEYHDLMWKTSQKISSWPKHDLFKTSP